MKLVRTKDCAQLLSVCLIIWKYRARLYAQKMNITRKMIFMPFLSQSMKTSIEALYVAFMILNSLGYTFVCFYVFLYRQANYIVIRHTTDRNSRSGQHCLSGDVRLDCNSQTSNEVICGFTQSIRINVRSFAHFIFKQFTYFTLLTK